MAWNWTQEFAAWLDRNARRNARRKRFHLSSEGLGRAAMIARLEVLEPRTLLTNVVAVTVNGNSISLADASTSQATTGDNFSVSYTSTQVVLTGTNGTSFRVGGQSQTTYTATITGPASISMKLGSLGNTVTITGDGTASLSTLNVNLGSGSQKNSLNLSNVIADSVSVTGGHQEDSVTLSHCTINSNLYAKLGDLLGDSLTLESTTIKGDVTAWVGTLFTDFSTISGKLTDVQSGDNNVFTMATSTFGGGVSINMGRYSSINLLSSAAGSSHFHGSVTIMGVRHRDITVSQHANSVVYDATPKYTHAGVVIPKAVTVTPPTVSTTVVATTTPKITGTYDSVNTPTLMVGVGGTVYTLGKDSQLTAPTAGNWSLDLTGAPLTSQTNVVTVMGFSNQNDSYFGASNVTNEQAIITKYLTANNLTATKTTTGLDYVVTTNGTGATPKSGDKVTVNYTGHILNSDGTLGTEFDSNVDAQFNHVSPFQFTVGQGQVIAGWDQAFQLLPIGTVAKLIIPSALAYGKSGSGSSIPANSILIFDVTLVSSP